MGLAFDKDLALDVIHILCSSNNPYLKILTLCIYDWPYDGLAYY